LVDEAEVHKMVHSEDVRKHKNAIGLLTKCFSTLDDKEQAWKYLLELTKYEDSEVRRIATYALGSAFAHVIDKEQAWEDLLALIKNEDSDVRWGALIALGSAFAHVTDKEQAWEDLLALIKDEDSDVRLGAARALGSAFAHVTDKEQAWEDLLALIKDEDSDVQLDAADALGSAFAHVTDKEQAWEDLLALTKDRDSFVRGSAALALGSAFVHITDKEQAWEDLHALIKDEDSFVRWGAADALGSAFAHVTDKEQAWEDLHALIKDKDNFVRWGAADALGSAFAHVTDKEQAWEDLHALIKDKNSDVRKVASQSLSMIARYYLDKNYYKKAFQCFYGSASAFKYTLINRIITDNRFYLYMGLGSYYEGRAVVNELSGSKNPNEYVKNLKYAVELFEKSIKYIEKAPPTFEHDTRCFPICLNIYSAYYEYNLALQKSDEKRVANAQNYLDEASKQCKIMGTKKGEQIVTVFEKLTKALTSRLNSLELEIKKMQTANGIAETKRYEAFIDKSREDFKNHIDELEKSLDELEAPIITGIVEFEKKNLEKLEPKKGERISPKSFREKPVDFIKKWKFVILFLAAVVAFLANLTTIIENLT